MKYFLSFTVACLVCISNLTESFMTEDFRFENVNIKKLKGGNHKDTLRLRAGAANMQKLRKFLSEHCEDWECSITTVITSGNGVDAIQFQDPEVSTVVCNDTRESRQTSAAVTMKPITSKSSAAVQVTHSVIEKPKCEANFIRRGCIWIFLSGGEDVSYADGERICRDKSSSVADIQNETEYEETMKVFRTKLEAKDYLNVWINGRWEKGTPQPSDDLPFAKWTTYESRPTEDDSMTHIHLYVDKNRKYDGMINKNPDNFTNGVVCQITA